MSYIFQGFLAKLQQKQDAQLPRHAAAPKHRAGYPRPATWPQGPEKCEMISLAKKIQKYTDSTSNKSKYKHKYRKSPRLQDFT